MSIDFSEITVVVQGAVHEKWTPRCLASVREHLPGSRIILSTWMGSRVAGMDCDCIVLSEDPGGHPVYDYPDSPTNNVNRQIRSTKNGIEQATTPYVLKIRSDFYLRSNSFLEYFGQYCDYDPDYAFLSSKALACSIYARNPRRRVPDFPSLVLHPSDFFFFGKTSDLIKVYGVPLMSEDDHYWYQGCPDQRFQLWPWSLLKSRFSPEQFIWISFLNKFIHVPVEHGMEHNDRLVTLTEATLANNLVLLSPSQLGIDCSKDSIWTHATPEICYTHLDWLAIYRRYCSKKTGRYFLFRLKSILHAQRAALC